MIEVEAGLSLTDTEFILRDWRFGQTQAERLCAALLHLESFTDIDPQHPLGGPDGGKDILCKKAFRLFVAAAYFPGTAVTFAEIKSKFSKDLLGVKRNDATGFCFFVNQKISVGERSELKGLAPDDVVVEVFHVERMRAKLDSPPGYGIRLEYLRIPMTIEDQLAYFSAANSNSDARLARIEKLQENTLRLLVQETSELKSSTQVLIDGFELLRTSHAGSKFLSTVEGFPTSHLSVGLVCWFHRILTSTKRGRPGSGVLRNVDVYIEALDGGPSFLPPTAADVPRLLDDWASAWREVHDDVLTSPISVALQEMVKFYYEFLRIHPFIDGNGRIAYVLLSQVVREVLDKTVSADLHLERQDHQAALLAANGGDLGPLVDRVRAAIES
jgi:hypothetical protein